MKTNSAKTGATNNHQPCLSDSSYISLFTCYSNDMRQNKIYSFSDNLFEIGFIFFLPFFNF